MGDGPRYRPRRAVTCTSHPRTVGEEEVMVSSFVSSREEEGRDATEYGLLVAFIAFLVIAGRHARYSAGR